MNIVASDTTSNTTCTVVKVAIVGAGITGLTAAHRLLRRSTSSCQFHVSLFEADSRVGGIISTRYEKNCTLEDGPDSFITFKPGGIELCQELGLEEQIITTNSRFRRAFVAWKGQLEPIPEGFNMIAPTRFDKLFASKLFSRTGKLRMAFEQFIPKGPRLTDESVASFVRRRFGKEALTRIGQPLIGGIYTADPETLSLRATVPKYLDYEQKYGSVTKGLLAEQSKTQKNQKTSHAGARYSAFVSFDKGVGVLVDTLVESIGKSNIHTNTKIKDLNYQEETRQWDLRFDSGESQKFDHVILTTPSYVSADLLKSIDPELAANLGNIEYASSAVLNLVFNREQIQHSLDGFGFVVPAKENRQIIAGSFTSVKFPNRCPENQAILRVFLGGAMQERILQNDDQTLIKIALSELNHYVKFTGAPLSTSVKRYARSMPQYKLNHHLLSDSLLTSIKRHSGLYIAGAYINGVGIPDCIASANKACEALMESLSLKK
ncbi:MAG: protoporphyrinogen oxidase [Candidatus Obscuribacterales bacterium]|nr:protoporphyrinogen oxidase [Candidatus Obscuribacterales bacterium]